MPFPQVYISTWGKTRGITIKYGTLGLILKIGCFMTNTSTESKTMEENVVQCWMNTLLLNLGTDSIINSITQNFVILTSYLSPLNLNTIIYPSI